MSDNPEGRKQALESSIPLDDPLLRELVEKLQRLLMVMRDEWVPGAQEPVHEALTALTTRYPSLASPEIGAEK